MQSPHDSEVKEKKNLKRLWSPVDEMPNDKSIANHLENCNVFPIEEIVRYPLPGYGVPTSITFSPDDSSITYLFSPEHTLNRRLYAFDPKNGKHELFFSPPGGGLDENNLSVEEKLRRERLRERGLGVTRYEWVKTSPKRKRLMIPLPAGIYVQDVGAQPELKIGSSSSSPIFDPYISPNGTMISYVKDNELHVFNLLYGTSNQLTTSADGNNITHGLAEYIAQEEMDRKNGYWWSLDGKYIAFAEVDSSEIPTFRIMHQGKACVGSEAQEDHAYPFTGGPNAKVRLGVVSCAGGPTTWMDICCGGGAGEDQTNADEEYLARVNWMHGNILTAQVLNRTHTKIKILRFDVRTGQRKLVLEEENETWINLHDCFTPLDRLPNKSSPGFIWASEKSGFRHLYLHDLDGNCLGALTEGDWMVEQVAGVNEVSWTVYFSGTYDGPLESHLYSINISLDKNGSAKTPLRLTDGKGKHSVVVDHQLQRFVDIYDSLGSPPKITLHSLADGSFITSVFEQPVSVITSKITKLRLEPPEIALLRAKDGTELYGALYKPDAAKFGPPPYKTMIHVYGGPCVQLVSDSWANTVDMRAQFLRSKGILVWKMDNRGTARRGLQFEGAIKHNFGQIDSEDQLTGAQWLVKHGLAKPDHIGLYGWSYGGYLSSMALSRFPETFRCAVSGAPVTSWDGYDTFYTEKYMGLPGENRAGYEVSSVMSHVENLEDGRRLMLVHGMIDENVHFRHTARLVNALVRARKFYELLIFPDERHMPRGLGDRVYMEERIWSFIEKSL